MFTVCKDIVYIEMKTFSGCNVFRKFRHAKFVNRKNNESNMQIMLIIYFVIVHLALFEEEGLII